MDQLCGHLVSGGQMHDSFLVELIAGEFAGDDALVHDQRSVGHAEHLLHLAGDLQFRHAASGQFLHQPVIFLFRADVNPPGRLVEQQ